METFRLCLLLLISFRLGLPIGFDRIGWKLSFATTTIFFAVKLTDWLRSD